MSAKYLAQGDLSAWLGALAQGRRVLVPVRENGAVVFRPYGPGTKPVLTRQADSPPKESVFPSTERLMEFSYSKDAENLGKVALDIKETVNAPATVVFGGRPCDARGFTVFDRVYDTKTIRDPYYAERRASTLFVTLACDTPETTCFCNSVGSSPVDADGSDVLLTPVDGGWLVEAVSERGKALLDAPALKDATAAAQDQAKAAKEAAEAAMPPAWDAAPAAAKLLEKFDDMGFWDDVSAKCISCGACTYLCPTCYCFTVTDERSGMKGERIRTWDTCMSFQFTLEASGHNPRPTKAHRLKNRVGHKFSYYPDIHKGPIACCGCGRCIKLCPVSVDIREIVRLAMELPTATAGKP
nr:4Fe-4S dicluster domain-containing protein [Fundidesulfovibrio agrisoli]